MHHLGFVKSQYVFFFSWEYNLNRYRKYEPINITSIVSNLYSWKTIVLVVIISYWTYLQWEMLFSILLCDWHTTGIWLWKSTFWSIRTCKKEKYGLSYRKSLLVEFQTYPSRPRGKESTKPLNRAYSVPKITSTYWSKCWFSLQHHLSCMAVV